MEYRLTGMRFETHNGWYEWERKKGSVWEVDVAYTMPEEDVKEDDLVEVFNYEKVYEIVSEVMRDEVRLIETMAKRLKERLERANERTSNWRVTVRKLNPPFEGETKSVEVSY